MIIPKGPYQVTYERLFDEAKKVFFRLRSEPENYAEHLILLENIYNSFDHEESRGILDSLCAEIHSTILSFPQDKRKDASQKIYDELCEGGYISGSKYQHLDREARKIFRYYAKRRFVQDDQDIIDNFGREDVTYSVKDVLDWLYYYSNTVAGWWAKPVRKGTNDGVFSEFYQAKTTREFVTQLLKDDTPDIVKTRLISHLSGLRSSVEWEAIAVIIHDCKYFDQKKAKKEKVKYYKDWFPFFCNLLEIPPFTKRPGNIGVKEKVNELLNGEFNFLPKYTR